MKESIQYIRESFDEAGADEKDTLCEHYSLDERSGVQALIKRWQREKIKITAEDERLEQMLYYERKYPQFEYICGIDEAGRGPLAGPVVAGAVILPKDLKICYLNDSKQLSAKLRDQLFDEIMAKAIAVGVGIVDAGRIDEINILKATFEAMRHAVDGLAVKPQVLLNDAVHIPGISLPQEKIIKGDAKSLSIAAASVIAKVTRDRMMAAYSELFPEYGFEKHKGYGSTDHIRVIQTIGPSPIHRQSFIKNFV